MIEYAAQQHHAYKALGIAADRIGANNYASGRYRPTYRRGKLVRGYSITQEHRDVLQTMQDVMTGTITPEEAMALLHGYDIMKQRLGK